MTVTIAQCNQVMRQNWRRDGNSEAGGWGGGRGMGRGVSDKDGVGQDGGN